MSRNRVGRPPRRPRRHRPATSRRSLLRAVGAGAVAAPLAGCSGDPPEPHLGGGQVFNGHDEPHEVAVLLERDGDIVHWRHSTLAPNGEDGFGYSIERTWPEEPATFRVSAMRDGERWRRATLEAPVSAESCAEVYVFVNATGRLRIAFEEPSGGEYYCSSA